MTDWYIDALRSSTRFADSCWERGIVFRKGRANPRNQMPRILEDAEQNITPRIGALPADLWQERRQLEPDINHISEAIERSLTIELNFAR